MQMPRACGVTTSAQQIHQGDASTASASLQSESSSGYPGASTRFPPLGTAPHVEESSLSDMGVRVHVLYISSMDLSSVNFEQDMAFFLPEAACSRARIDLTMASMSHVRCQM
jgi:hypothetical protein